MQKIINLYCLLMFVALVPRPAEADVDYGIDVEKLTCIGYFDRIGELNKTNKQTAALLTYWLFGYVSGIQNSAKLTQSRYLEFHNLLGDHCKKNPNELLLVSVRKIALKK